MNRTQTVINMPDAQVVAKVKKNYSSVSFFIYGRFEFVKGENGFVEPI
jgi:hypothetical protein